MVIKIKKREDNLYNRIGVYAVVNKVNGFTYVGQTAMNFGDRRDSHFSLLRNGKHPCKEMQIDFNKYGEKNFEFVVLCDSNSREEIDRFEDLYIKKYKSKGLSYNKVPGGFRQGQKGLHTSDHAKRLIGKKNREHMLGRKASKETKEKMSETRKEKINKMSLDEKRKLIEPMITATRGKKFSDEKRAKVIEYIKTIG